MEYGESEVRKIRAGYIAGKSIPSLAREFSLPNWTIREIVLNRVTMFYDRDYKPPRKLKLSDFTDYVLVKHEEGLSTYAIRQLLLDEKSFCASVAGLNRLIARNLG